MHVCNGFWLMHDIVEEYYEHIVLGTRKSIRDYSMFVSLEFEVSMVRLMYQLKDLINICEQKNITIHYTGIMCRRHLKKINKRFHLGYEDMKTLYVDLSESVIIVNKQGIKKLVYIAPLHKFAHYIDIVTSNDKLTCYDCQKSLEDIVDHKHSKLNVGFCVSKDCNRVVCKSCSQRNT